MTINEAARLREEEFHEFEIHPHKHCECVREATSGLKVFDHPHVYPSMWLGRDDVVYRWRREVGVDAPDWIVTPPETAYPLERIRWTGAHLDHSAAWLEAERNRARAAKL